MRNERSSRTFASSAMSVDINHDQRQILYPLYHDGTSSMPLKWSHDVGGLYLSRVKTPLIEEHDSIYIGTA